MMNALHEMRLQAEESAEAWAHYVSTGFENAYYSGKAEHYLDKAVKFAAIAQAEAQERQAAAAEKANEIAAAQRADQERQAAQIFGVLARIAAVAEWYQKWRDWDGAEELPDLRAAGRH